MSGKTISVSYDELQGVINEMKSTKKNGLALKKPLRLYQAKV